MHSCTNNDTEAETSNCSQDFSHSDYWFTITCSPCMCKKSSCTTQNILFSFKVVILIKPIEPFCYQKTEGPCMYITLQENTLWPVCKMPGCYAGQNKDGHLQGRHIYVSENGKRGQTASKRNLQDFKFYIRSPMHSKCSCLVDRRHYMNVY